MLKGQAFGDKIKELRKARGWGRRKLAAELNCSPGAIQNWERGTVPNHRLLRKVYELFGKENFVDDGEAYEQDDDTEDKAEAPQSKTMPSGAGGVILSERKARGWSQRKLAELSGVSLASLNRWEHGANVSRAKYEQLTECFNTRPVDDAPDDDPDAAEAEPDDDEPEADAPNEPEEEDEQEDEEEEEEEGEPAEPAPPKSSKQSKERELEETVAEEIACAVRMARSSGDPKWCIIVLPDRNGAVDIRVCARPKGSRD